MLDSGEAEADVQGLVGLLAPPCGGCRDRQVGGWGFTFSCSVVSDGLMGYFLNSGQSIMMERHSDSEEQRWNPCLLSHRQTAVRVCEAKEWWGGSPRDDRFGGYTKNPEVPGGNSWTCLEVIAGCHGA